MPHERAYTQLVLSGPVHSTVTGADGWAAPFDPPRCRASWAFLKERSWRGAEKVIGLFYPDSGTGTSRSSGHSTSPSSSSPRGQEACLPDDVAFRDRAQRVLARR